MSSIEHGARKYLGRSAICLLVLSLTSCQARPASNSSGAVESLTLVSRSPGRWARYGLQGKERRIDVYVAHDDRPKPIVVLLHGSSCGPDFTVDADKSLRETSIFQDAIGPSLKRTHFAVVERPGVEPLIFAAGMTQDENEARLRVRNDSVVPSISKPLQSPLELPTPLRLFARSKSSRLYARSFLRATPKVLMS